MINHSKIHILVCGLVFLVLPFFYAKATVQDEIDARNRQIEEIQKQIDEYQKQIEGAHSQSQTLQNEIDNLNAKINQVQLEIRSLGLSIKQTGLEIGDTQSKISDAEDKINKHKNALARYIKIAYENDQRSLTEILLKNDSLSIFFNELNSIQKTQNNLKTAIDDIKELKGQLELRQTDLEEKQVEFERLKSLQEIENKSLGQNKNQKNHILKETKGQESKYQELVKRSQKDIQAIKDQIGYLVQNGVTAEEAIKFGQLSAIGTGIRPAFLIAILEIESGLGKNVGKGNWMDDMYNCYLRLGKLARAETEKNAFLAIIGKLGLDASTVKVSKEPYYGCGGALGPAQFLPSIWLTYEEEVARLTNHKPPNPWSIEDAFMASAIKLARGGADQKTRDAETRAAKTYLSGKPTCGSRICNYYASAVLRKAAELELSL